MQEKKKIVSILKQQVYFITNFQILVLETVIKEKE